MSVASGFKALVFKVEEFGGSWFYGLRVGGLNVRVLSLGVLPSTLNPKPYTLNPKP